MRKAIAILLAVLFLVTMGISTAASQPQADFTASPLIHSAPSAVKFTDVSTGSPIYWFWYFGDGTTSTLKNPMHLYTRRGFYSVTLCIKAYYNEQIYTSNITKSRYIAVL